MPFKFINWFLEHQEEPNLLGEIAKKCMNDPKFPTQAKHSEEVFDYLKNKKSTKKEIQAVKVAWNKYRKLGKVKAISLSVLRAKI
jgi:uncharacterized protein YozE (UPF0346 family)